MKPTDETWGKGSPKTEGYALSWFAVKLNISYKLRKYVQRFHPKPQKSGSITIMQGTICIYLSHHRNLLPPLPFSVYQPMSDVALRTDPTPTLSAGTDFYREHRQPWITSTTIGMPNVFILP